MVKLCKITNIVISTQVPKNIGAGRAANSHNTTSAVLLGKTDGCRAIFNQKTICKTETKSACCFQMHGTLIGKSAIIVYNLVPVEPTPKSEGIEIEINIGFDGSTCQRKGDTLFLKHLQKIFNTGNQM